MLLALRRLWCRGAQHQDAGFVPDEEVRAEVLQDLQAQASHWVQEEVLQEHCLQNVVHHPSVVAESVRQGAQVCEALQNVQDGRRDDAMQERLPQRLHGGEEEVRLPQGVPPPEILPKAVVRQADHAGHVCEAARVCVAQGKVHQEEDG